MLRIHIYEQNRLTVTVRAMLILAAMLYTLYSRRGKEPLYSLLLITNDHKGEWGNANKVRKKYIEPQSHNRQV